MKKHIILVLNILLTIFLTTSPALASIGEKISQAPTYQKIIGCIFGVIVIIIFLLLAFSDFFLNKNKDSKKENNIY